MVTSVPYELAMVSILGFGTTSSSLLGAAIGLYFPLSKRPLACLLAFAAGALISALAIELAYEGALSLHQQGFDVRAGWVFVSRAGRVVTRCNVTLLASQHRCRKGYAPPLPFEGARQRLGHHTVGIGFRLAGLGGSAIRSPAIRGAAVLFPATML